MSKCIINGIGWQLGDSCGGFRRGTKFAIAGEREQYKKLLAEGILLEKVRSFGRFDLDSKRIFIVASLAMFDAGLALNNVRKDIGLVRCNHLGSAMSNVGYWQDYLAGGRSLARGNLFIYTLPTSGLAEVAVAFGLTGNLSYYGGNSIGDMLRYVEEFVFAGNLSQCLAVFDEPSGAVCFVCNNGGMVEDSDLQNTVMCSINDNVKTFVKKVIL